MKLKLSLVITTLSTIFFLSCNKSIEIEDFDSQQWDSERITCKTYRQSAAGIIKNQSSIFIGQSEHNVQQLLGRPDRIDLGRKHTKVIIYQINNIETECKSDDKQYKFNFIRFELDTLGYVKFVTWDD